MSEVDAVWRAHSRRVLATLIRLLKDFDRAEEALGDAFAAAAEQWPRDGVPANPVSWLVSAGRFKAIDRIRRRARFDRAEPDLILIEEARMEPLPDPESIADDQLRLIFTCCHPALPPDAQIAMTLREVCGLTTEAIAAAFLAKPAAIAQRIVRAKSRIRDEHLPYEVPDPAALPERLEMVLHTLYLVFNEGYAAATGNTLTRPDLCTEAIRLGRLLVELLPEPDAFGLLALMLLQDSRRNARADAAGGLILLPDQDRRLWDQAQIAEGMALSRRAFASPPLGAYTIEAGIAAVHAAAPDAASTDWGEIVRRYDLLRRADPSPIVLLNRGVAVAMRDGPAAGLTLIEALAEGDLVHYRYAHAARADLLRRLGRNADAHAAYGKALALTEQAAERDFLENRMRSLAN